METLKWLNRASGSCNGRDAHATEEQAETMLSGQLSRIDSYPELSERIRSHLEETKEQARRLRPAWMALTKGHPC